MEIIIKADEKLINAVHALAAAMENFVVATKPPLEVKESTVDKEKAMDEIKRAVDTPVKTVKVPTEEKPSGFTLEEVRSAFVSKNTPEKRPVLKDILTKYGAKTISSIEEKDFASIMQDLKDI